MATHNQIAYAEYKERLRHNVVSEKETERTNRANEALRGMELSETTRHNLANEHLSERDLEEKIRSNMARENLGWAQLEETQRHNLVSEEVDRIRAIEQGRHNRATEALGEKQYSLGVFQAGEQQRHNQATEYNDRLRVNVEQQKLSNDVARIAETIRANKANESLRGNENWIRLQNVYAQIQRNEALAKREGQQSAQGWVGLIEEGIDLIAKLFLKKKK